MPQEYASTLAKLKPFLETARDIAASLTLNRNLEFDERVVGYVADLIEEIEAEGTEQGK